METFEILIGALAFAVIAGLVVYNILKKMGVLDKAKAKIEEYKDR